MRTSDIRDTDDLLAYVAGILRDNGRPVEAGMVVDLEPLFRDVFLGGEITRLDRVIEAATPGGRWLRAVGGSGRRYALTEAGAERAHAASSASLRKLPVWGRVLVAILVALLLAAIIF